MTGRRGESGAALLTVLVLVVAIAVIAATMIERMGLARATVRNAALADQARAHALSAYRIAMRASDRLQDAGGTARAANALLQMPLRLDLPGGAVTVRARDAALCFNLNALVSGNAVTGYAPDPAGSAQFLALAAAAGISPAAARAVEAAALNRIARDGVLVAETGFALRARGLGDAEARRLSPLLCALPVAGPTPLNVNALGPDGAPLVAMLVPGLPPQIAQRMIALRPSGGYRAPEDFWAPASRAGYAPGPAALKASALGPQWLAVAVENRLGDAQFAESGLIDARVAPARLVRRMASDWGAALDGG